MEAATDSGGEPSDAASAETGAGAEAPAADAPTEKAEETPQAASLPSDAGQTPPLPPASFDMLVLSLAMQAQMELGGGMKPEGQPPNLEIARHTIDLLAMLQEKTKGNLSLEENRMLENTLTELRFRFVQVVGEINKKAGS